MEENYKLSHLRELEAESIHIIREVAQFIIFFHFIMNYIF